MIRQPRNSPILFLRLLGTTICLTGYWIVYSTLHPAEFAAYLWLVVIVEVTLYLGWVYPDDMAAVRPFATHLAEFLALPLEFTKGEKPVTR